MSGHQASLGNAPPASSPPAREMLARLNHSGSSAMELKNLLLLAIVRIGDDTALDLVYSGLGGDCEFAIGGFG